MEIVVGVLGGLGLFLYGMNLMGMALQKVAGEKLKSLIEVLTNNRIMGVVVGAVVTMLIQSSSATTVMVVGFVNAGLMTLTQSIGVIMGANIGTTVTAQLVAFKLTDIAPLVIAIGVTIWLVSSKRKNKEIAEILIGFGILFIGMDFMSDSLAVLRDSPVFIDVIRSLKNPMLGIIIGFGMTVVLQSSSASMGILLALAATGTIGVDVALPIMFGQNIGTCVTAILSSIGASKTAKRAAFMHLWFNVVGTIIFMTILRYPLEYVVTEVLAGDTQRQIANAHTLFNILNVVIQLPFAGFIVKMAKKVIPGEDEQENGLKYLDTRIMETPSIAVGQAAKEVLRMGKIVDRSLKVSIESFFKQDEKLTHKIFEDEKKINRLEKDIIQYLAKLSQEPLTGKQINTVNTLFNTVNDLERVADHADNIAELAQYSIDNKLEFTDKAIKELEIMFEKVEHSFKTSIIAYKTADPDIARDVIKYEREIDKMEKQLRSNHISRVNKSLCYATSGIVFLDIISNLERIADHASNIAISILDAVE